MKKFILSALSVSIFCVGLGAIAENTGARFKSDQKALDIIAKARQAIGGDAAIAEIRSMVIKGQTTHTLKLNGGERTEQAETEIVMEMPNRFSKMIKIAHGTGTEGAKTVIENKDVIILRKGDGEPIELKGGEGTFTTSNGKTITITKADGAVKEIETADGNKIIVRSDDTGNAEGRKVIVTKTGDGNAEFKVEGVEPGTADGKTIRIARLADGPHGLARHNELLRTTLAMLLSAPEGTDVTYTFVGESQVDGTAVNIVAASAQGSNFKLYFDRSSNLPVGMSYVGHPMPVVVKFQKGDAPAEGGEKHTFTRKLEGVSEAVEHFVKFTDFRSTNGVLMPYNWTTTVAGAVREIFEIASVEVNPTNISERFGKDKVMIRTAKPSEQK